MDSSGTVDTSDALGVLRKAVGQPDQLTCLCADLGPVCGNGVVEGEEDCDVGTINGKSCVALGFSGGALTCGPGCSFNTGGCYAERFVAIGYGAVFDRRTELSWEMKRSFDGGAADPHDVDNLYTWTGGPGGTAPDGTAFTDFLAKLNDNCTVSGSQDDLAGSFGAHCDWRLPTATELKSIRPTTCPGEGSPCIDPIFGPTKADAPYWTSMTVGEAPASAIVVSFADGSEGHSPKDNAGYVRAVRGVMRLGILGAGSFPCPETGCGEGRVCVEYPGGVFNYCALRCEQSDIGIRGPCGSPALCSDVDPGPGVTPACAS